MESAQSASVRPRVREASADRLSLWRIPRTRALLLLGTLGVVGGVVALLARFYTDLLWFHELGVVRVYLSSLRWHILAQGVVGLGTACFLLLNFAVVERVVAHVGDDPVRAGRVVTALRAGRRLIYPVVAIAGGLVSLQSRPANIWQLLALWANRTDFGVTDPVYHRDVGYYVFSLPLYQQVADWLLQTVVMGGAATVAAYAVLGGPGLRRWLVAARAARAHLLALGALLLLVVAWRMRLDQLALVVPHDDSRVPGASYTDIRIVSPAFTVLVVTAVAGAGLCVYATVRRLPLLPFAAVGLVAAAALVGKSELPALVERFDVQPQELSRELPQLKHAIAFTRRALALDRVSIKSTRVGVKLSAKDVRDNRRTLDNVPLWDAGVLRPALNDLQSIGPYYGFPSVTVDRYTIDGNPKVVMLAARQLDRRRLGREGRGWATARFAYTHGFGVVAAEPMATDPARQPSFAQEAFSPSPNPLGLRQPRVYYGERRESSPPYVIVNSRRGEIDAPRPGSSAPEYHYDGSGGIPLSSTLRRLAFAARFADLRLLLTGTATDSSRIVMCRSVRDRLTTLAPFLRWDSDPQTAVVDGRVQFVFHGYTTSASYPYAAPFRMDRETVNYVRGSAVAAVDGFTGHVSIYVADPGDPIMRAWQGAYPGLFQPASRMPEDLRDRLRYPETLFAAQVAAYATYHADDATAFWNGADAWQRPQQLAGPVEVAGEIHFPDPEQRVDGDQRREGQVMPRNWKLVPQYLLARFPGEQRERFMLATPFTPRGSQNLVAYLAGSLDRRGRPRLTLLSLPRDRLTLGPTQATRRILANSEVNRRLDLLNRESRDLGSSAVNRTILGAPRTVPVAGTLVYVQPIYLAAGGSGLPRLQLVTVLANGRVGYGPTLRAALGRTL